MPQLQPDYYTTDVAPPTLAITKSNTSNTSNINSKTYLKYKAKLARLDKLTKFKKSAIVKIHIINKPSSSSSNTKFEPSTRSRSSSTSTIFVDDASSKSEGEDKCCCCCLEQVPNYTVTTTECSPRISLDELQDSLVEENKGDDDDLEEKNIRLFNADEKSVDDISIVPSSPPPQYKSVALAASPSNEMEMETETEMAVSPTEAQIQPRSHTPSITEHRPTTSSSTTSTTISTTISTTNTPINPTQIKFKSQLNQYLASIETEDLTYFSEPYTSLKQYNKSTMQQYSRYKLINDKRHHCINYYWLYLDIRTNNQLIDSMYVSWYSWMSGLITFMIIYALFVCLC